ncbi:MAG: metallophosphoesterase [Actinomycetia bacterium]|nr:metallophosphoesterase [Actinomycetes bacterium]
MTGWFWVFGGAAAGAAAYAVLGEPYWIREVTYVVPAEGKDGLDGLSVVLLTDLHGRADALARPTVQGWIAAADLVVVAGDLYSPLRPRRPLARALVRLDPARLVFVSGNHDWRRGRLDLAPWVPPPGVVLDNRWIRRERRGAPYVVAGLPDLERGRPDWDAFADIPAGLPALLVSHRPDAVLDPRSARFFLVLAGHTHGGQVAIPGWGPILRHTRVPRRAAAGLSRWPPDRWLVVSRGLGTSELPIRFGARPEVVRVVVRVRPASGAPTSGQWIPPAESGIMEETDYEAGEARRATRPHPPDREG